MKISPLHAWEARCLVPGCPTRLQRSADGTLEDGVNEHLKIVHPEEYAAGMRGVDLRKSTGGAR